MEILGLAHVQVLYTLEKLIFPIGGQAEPEQTIFEVSPGACDVGVKSRVVKSQGVSLLKKNAC